MPALQTNNAKINNQGYIIPDSVIIDYPDLIEMIKQTDSMNLEEKNYWFKIMPMMNQEQIDNLRSILVKERQKLDEINQKYAEDLTEINNRHQIELTNAQREKAKAEREKAEANTEVEESEQEEALLDELAEL